MFIIPYLVLAGVVLLFFAVTCLMIFGLPRKKKNAEPIMADLDKTMEIPTISKEKAAASPIAGKPATSHPVAEVEVFANGLTDADLGDVHAHECQ